MLPSPYEAVLQNFTAEDKSKILYILGRYPGPYPGWSRMFRL